MPRLKARLQARLAFTTAIVLTAVAVGGGVWLMTGHHASKRAVQVAAPPLTPPPHRLAKRYRTAQGPLSTTPPKGNGLGAPDDLTGTPGAYEVTLTWWRVSGATDYQIFQDGRQIAQTTGLSFDDTGLKPGVKHTWWVAAVGGDHSAPYTGAARR